METHSCLLVVFAVCISLDGFVPPRRLRSPLCVEGLCGSDLESCEGSDYVSAPAPELVEVVVVVVVC